MACILESDLSTESCSMSIGGLKGVWLANKADIDSTTSPSQGIVSAVTMVSPETFFVMGTEKDKSSFTQIFTPIGNTGFVVQTLDLFLNPEYISGNITATALALGEFVAIVETLKGEKFIMGRGNSLRSTVVDFNSGVATGDIRNLHVTMVANELEFIPKYTGTIPLV